MFSLPPAFAFMRQKARWANYFSFGSYFCEMILFFFLRIGLILGLVFIFGFVFGGGAVIVGVPGKRPPVLFRWEGFLRFIRLVFKLIILGDMSNPLLCLLSAVCSSELCISIHQKPPYRQDEIRYKVHVLQFR